MKRNLIVILVLAFYSQSLLAAEFVFEKDSSLPLVRVNVVFRGGASTDPDLKNGTTDLMGKMMLRGTKSKTKNQIDLLLDQLGGSINVDNRSEYLSFTGNVLSENIGPFMELFTEILASPSFRPGEFEKLKKEQMSALQDALGQDREVARLRFDQIFFKKHPYSKSNQGRVSEIASIQIADLQHQYQKLIRDSQMFVLASGDVQQKAFDPLLSTFQEQRNSNKTPLSPLEEFKDTPKKLKVVIVDKPDRTQTQVVIGKQGIKITSPDMDALTLANHAFGGGTFMSRLMVELRVKRGWTYGAGSNFKFGSQPHTWRISFFPKNVDTPPAILEALKMIQDLKTKGLTAEEFDFAQKSLVNSAGFNFNTPEKRLSNQLVEKLFGLPEGYHRNMAHRISALTLEQVNLALSRFLGTGQFLVEVVGTADKSKKDLAQALKISENEIEVQNYLKD